MEDLLRFVVGLIARIHEKIMSVNDGFSFGLNDKQLHFLVIGIFGICVFFVVQTVFKWLAKKRVTAISWIYTFTVVIVVTFAIEIGQRVSGTGEMESSDIFYGVWGFLAAFAVYLIVRGVIRLIRRVLSPDKGALEQPVGKRSFIGERSGRPKG